MIKFNRPAPPPFLAENYKQWGREHKQRRDSNPSAAFQWKSHQGQRVNELILQALDVVAKQHCAFCDGYPLGTFARRTIEHFRPVSRYPRLAYVWHNLFVCCDICQSAKLEAFDKHLLKPDREDYAFERYFIINYKSGELEANPAASETEQQCARLTIEIYGLNRYGRPQSRLRAYRDYQQLANQGYTLDDFPYRFFLV